MTTPKTPSAQGAPKREMSISEQRAVTWDCLSEYLDSELSEEDRDTAGYIFSSSIDRMTWEAEDKAERACIETVCGEWCLWTAGSWDEYEQVPRREQQGKAGIWWHDKKAGGMVMQCYASAVRELNYERHNPFPDCRREDPAKRGEG